MNKVSFEGFGARYLTFKKASGSTLAKGDFVSISANETVTTASTGEIVGLCTDICGDLVTVQVSGYIKAAYASGQSVTLGKCHLGLDSSGKIKVLSSAPSVLVTDIDTTNLEIGFIL